ncbi:hypothetical protein SAMN00120144_4018 [Hymenobacter roseosalivarius DSM 11622]|uniref:Uncharacterized protein n=1 Tax=Hymenobacter roseosalivarius DSM 11622 TaxID=645990 RepID=A0A1W1UIP2_9BACT|nr:hypothetical protein SAMN00120144_4018 [Hymenobacter roseosalivarius DSM 11622]
MATARRRWRECGPYRLHASNVTIPAVLSGVAGSNIAQSYTAYTSRLLLHVYLTTLIKLA